MSTGKQSEFYNTPAWKNCREAYLRSRSGLCERCAEKGIFKPAEIVHHKIHISPENIQDPNVLLDWKNLQCVCRECHAELHEDYYQSRSKKRYKVDSFGRVTVKQDEDQ